MSTARIVEGQDTAWRYRCEVCGYRRTGHKGEIEHIEARHEEEHVDMYERAWAQLDEIVESVLLASRVVETSDWHGAGPEAHQDAVYALLYAQERGRGASAILATMLQVEQSTIANEVGHRAVARAAGKVRRVLNSAELRGFHESGPNRGGLTGDRFEVPA